MRYLLMILGIFGTDYGLKEYTNSYRLQGEETLLRGKVFLRNYHNPGAALGFLKEYPKLNKSLSVFVLCGVIWEFLRTLPRRGYAVRKTGLALITGGGLNNCMERLKKGYVTDYIGFNVDNKKVRDITFNISRLLFVTSFPIPSPGITAIFIKIPPSDRALCRGGYQPPAVFQTPVL